MLNAFKAGLVTVLALTTVIALNAQVKPLVFKEYDMPNGMHVILHEDHSAPVVATVVHYKVGSRDEDPKRTGFAHFFEHLMFESTEMIERHNMDKLISSAGGQLNAYTSNDETVYHFVVPSTEVRLALWIESQRMRKLQVNAIGVETQRGVVKEERKNRYDNVPYGGWYEKMQSYLFRDSPYAWSPIGSSQHIDSASIHEFVDFYNEYYQPSNAILVVSGDFDEQIVKETINAYFGPYPKAPEPRRPQLNRVSDSIASVRETVNDIKARLPRLFIGYKSISISDADSYAIDLLTTIMSQGESSRLYKSIVDSQQIAVNVSLSNQFREYAGMTFIIGIPSAGNSLDAVEQSIDAQLKEVMVGGVTDAELQKAKNITEAQFVGSRTGMYNKALQLVSYYRYYHDTGLINTELDRYLKVTREDIQRVAKRLFEKKNRVVFYYLPSKG
ncbi:MAG: insulinase family protein [Ignavibacteria bacterium]|nr:insulinase family protein [Ignavibacteria bacterium]